MPFVPKAKIDKSLVFEEKDPFPFLVEIFGEPNLEDPLEEILEPKAQEPTPVLPRRRNLLVADPRDWLCRSPIG